MVITNLAVDDSLLVQLALTPNTQTFLPACLLPTACDYNGLDCFDPLVL